MIDFRVSWRRWVALAVVSTCGYASASASDRYFIDPQAGNVAPVSHRLFSDSCAPACTAPGDCGGSTCNTDGGSTCNSDGKDEKGPWTLLDIFTDDCGNNHLKDKGWQLGGYTQFGYQNNPDGAFTGNGNVLDDREWDRFLLNQQYLFLGKVADGSEGLGFGFRADLIYGVDGNEAQSFGNKPGRFDFLNGWDHGSYEWALPQLYAEVAYKDLSVKLGHFYTPIGYEVIPSNGNFFLSRQLTFYNSEPFTHTGALATYKASDKLVLTGGFSFGWDTGFDRLNGGGNAILGATYTIDDKSSIIYMNAFGDFGWRGQGMINSLIYSRQHTEKFQTVHQLDVLGTDLQSDFGFKGGPIPGAGPLFIGGVAGDSVGLINYAFYQLTDKVKLGARQEWYKADSVSYNTFTYGVNIKPIDNLIIRPEVRHMWSPGNGNHYTNAAGDVDEDLFNQTVFGVDAILTF